MSTVKTNAITGVTTNSNLALTGNGSGIVTIGDGNLKFPDADGNAAAVIGTDGSAQLAFLDTITSTSSNTNLTLSGNGTGGVKLNDYFIQTKGSDISSATSLTLGKDGNLFDVTGTTTITTIGTQGIGSIVTLQFDGALTFTHHSTNLILPGAANITTAAGDIAVMYEYASADWRCVSYTTASLAPAGVANNAVGLAQLTAGTDGNLFTFDTSGDPAFVSTGTSGHILTSAGAGAVPTFAANATIGQHTIWVPANAMEAAVTTAAATSNAVEIGTSLFAARTMDFATGADDFCYFGIQMPKSWDAGTLVCQFVWSATGTTANTVLWAIAATSLGNDEVLTTAFATPTSPAADTNSTTADDLMISAEVTLTVGSTPTEEDFVIFEVSRDVSGDTLAEDARLHGIKIHYTTDSGSDT